MGLKKNWILIVSSFFVITACFTILNGTLLASKNFRKLLGSWGDEAQMTIYLSHASTVGEKEEIEQLVKKNSAVDSVTYISQQMALEDFKKNMSSYVPEALQENEILSLIPASLQVMIKEDLSIQDRIALMNSLSEDLGKQPGVDEISYGQEWLDKYSRLVSSVEYSLQALALVVLLATIFVLSNVIRSSIYQRHEEIVVMEMVGATSATIRKPFIKEGLLIGLCSSVISMLVCGLFYKIIIHLINSDLGFLKIADVFKFYGPAAIIGLILAQTFLAGLSSYLCVRSINDGYAGRQMS